HAVPQEESVRSSGEQLVRRRSQSLGSIGFSKKRLTTRPPDSPKTGHAGGRRGSAPFVSSMAAKSRSASPDDGTAKKSRSVAAETRGGSASSTRSGTQDCSASEPPPLQAKRGSFTSSSSHAFGARVFSEPSDAGSQPASHRKPQTVSSPSSPAPRQEPCKAGDPPSGLARSTAFSMVSPRASDPREDRKKRYTFSTVSPEPPGTSPSREEAGPGEPPAYRRRAVSFSGGGGTGSAPSLPAALAARGSAGSAGGGWVAAPARRRSYGDLDAARSARYASNRQGVVSSVASPARRRSYGDLYAPSRRDSAVSLPGTRAAGVSWVASPARRASYGDLDAAHSAQYPPSRRSSAVSLPGARAAGIRWVALPRRGSRSLVIERPDFKGGRRPSAASSAFSAAADGRRGSASRWFSSPRRRAPLGPAAGSALHSTSARKRAAARRYVAWLRRKSKLRAVRRRKGAPLSASVSSQPAGASRFPSQPDSFGRRRFSAPSAPPRRFSFASAARRGSEFSGWFSSPDRRRSLGAASSAGSLSWGPPTAAAARNRAAARRYAAWVRGRSKLAALRKKGKAAPLRRRSHGDGDLAAAPSARYGSSRHGSVSSVASPARRWSYGYLDPARSAQYAPGRRGSAVSLPGAGAGWVASPAGGPVMFGRRFSRSRSRSLGAASLHVDSARNARSSGLARTRKKAACAAQKTALRALLEPALRGSYRVQPPPATPSRRGMSIASDDGCARHAYAAGFDESASSGQFDGSATRKARSVLDSAFGLVSFLPSQGSSASNDPPRQFDGSETREAQTRRLSVGEASVAQSDPMDCGLQTSVQFMDLVAPAPEQQQTDLSLPATAPNAPRRCGDQIVREPTSGLLPAAKEDSDVSGLQTSVQFMNLCAPTPEQQQIDLSLPATAPNAPPQRHGDRMVRESTSVLLSAAKEDSDVSGLQTSVQFMCVRAPTPEQQGVDLCLPATASAASRGVAGKTSGEEPGGVGHSVAGREASAASLQDSVRFLSVCAPTPDQEQIDLLLSMSGKSGSRAHAGGPARTLRPDLASQALDTFAANPDRPLLGAVSDLERGLSGLESSFGSLQASVKFMNVHAPTPEQQLIDLLVSLSNRAPNRALTQAGRSAESSQHPTAPGISAASADRPLLGADSEQTLSSSLNSAGQEASLGLLQSSVQFLNFHAPTPEQQQIDMLLSSSARNAIRALGLENPTPSAVSAASVGRSQSGAWSDLQQVVQRPSGVVSELERLLSSALNPAAREGSCASGLQGSVKFMSVRAPTPEQQQIELLLSALGKNASQAAPGEEAATAPALRQPAQSSELAERLSSALNLAATGSCDSGLQASVKFMSVHAPTPEQLQLELPLPTYGEDATRTAPPTSSEEAAPAPDQEQQASSETGCEPGTQTSGSPLLPDSNSELERLNLAATGSSDLGLQTPSPASVHFMSVRATTPEQQQLELSLSASGEDATRTAPLAPSEAAASPDQEQPALLGTGCEPRPQSSRSAPSPDSDELEQKSGSTDLGLQASVQFMSVHVEQHQLELPVSASGENATRTAPPTPGGATAAAPDQEQQALSGTGWEPHPQSSGNAPSPDSDPELEQKSGSTDLGLQASVQFMSVHAPTPEQQQLELPLSSSGEDATQSAPGAIASTPSESAAAAPEELPHTQLSGSLPSPDSDSVVQKLTSAPKLAATDGSCDSGLQASVQFMSVRSPTDLPLSASSKSGSQAAADAALAKAPTPSSECSSGVQAQRASRDTSSESAQQPAAALLSTSQIRQQSGPESDSERKSTSALNPAAKEGSCCDSGLETSTRLMSVHALTPEQQQTDLLLSASGKSDNQVASALVDEKATRHGGDTIHESSPVPTPDADRKDSATEASSGLVATLLQPPLLADDTVIAGEGKGTPVEGMPPVQGTPSESASDASETNASDTISDAEEGSSRRQRTVSDSSKHAADPWDQAEQIEPESEAAPILDETPNAPTSQSPEGVVAVSAHSTPPGPTPRDNLLVREASSDDTLSGTVKRTCAQQEAYAAEGAPIAPGSFSGNSGVATGALPEDGTDHQTPSMPGDVPGSPSPVASDGEDGSHESAAPESDFPLSPSTVDTDGRRQGPPERNLRLGPLVRDPDIDMPWSPSTATTDGRDCVPDGIRLRQHGDSRAANMPAFGFDMPWSPSTATSDGRDRSVFTGNPAGNVELHVSEQAQGSPAFASTAASTPVLSPETENRHGEAPPELSMMSSDLNISDEDVPRSRVASRHLDITDDDFPRSRFSSLQDSNEREASIEAQLPGRRGAAEKPRMGGPSSLQPGSGVSRQLGLFEPDGGCADDEDGSAMSISALTQGPAPAAAAPGLAGTEGGVVQITNQEKEENPRESPLPFAFSPKNDETVALPAGTAAPSREAGGAPAFSASAGGGTRGTDDQEEPPPAGGGASAESGGGDCSASPSAEPRAGAEPAETGAPGLPAAGELAGSRGDSLNALPAVAAESGDAAPAPSLPAAVNERADLPVSAESPPGQPPEAVQRENSEEVWLVVATPAPSLRAIMNERVDPPVSAESPPGQGSEEVHAVQPSEAVQRENSEEVWLVATPAPSLRAVVNEWADPPVSAGSGVGQGSGEARAAPPPEAVQRENSEETWLVATPAPSLRAVVNEWTDPDSGVGQGSGEARAVLPLPEAVQRENREEARLVAARSASDLASTHADARELFDRTCSSLHSQRTPDGALCELFAIQPRAPGRGGRYQQLPPSLLLEAVPGTVVEDERSEPPSKPEPVSESGGEPCRSTPPGSCSSGEDAGGGGGEGRMRHAIGMLELPEAELPASEGAGPRLEPSRGPPEGTAPGSEGGSSAENPREPIRTHPFSTPCEEDPGADCRERRKIPAPRSEGGSSGNLGSKHHGDRPAVSQAGESESSQTSERKHDRDRPALSQAGESESSQNLEGKHRRGRPASSQAGESRSGGEHRGEPTRTNPDDEPGAAGGDERRSSVSTQTQGVRVIKRTVVGPDGTRRVSVVRLDDEPADGESLAPPPPPPPPDRGPTPQPPAEAYPQRGVSLEDASSRGLRVSLPPSPAPDTPSPRGFTPRPTPPTRRRASDPLASDHSAPTSPTHSDAAPASSATERSPSAGGVHAGQGKASQAAKHLGSLDPTLQVLRESREQVQIVGAHPRSTNQSLGENGKGGVDQHHPVEGGRSEPAASSAEAPAADAAGQGSRGHPDESGRRSGPAQNASTPPQPRRKPSGRPAARRSIPAIDRDSDSGSAGGASTAAASSAAEDESRAGSRQPAPRRKRSAPPAGGGSKKTRAATVGIDSDPPTVRKHRRGSDLPLEGRVGVDGGRGEHAGSDHHIDKRWSDEGGEETDDLSSAAADESRQPAPRRKRSAPPGGGSKKTRAATAGGDSDPPTARKHRRGSDFEAKVTTLPLPLGVRVGVDGGGDEHAGPDHHIDERWSGEEGEGTDDLSSDASDDWACEIEVQIYGGGSFEVDVVAAVTQGLARSEKARHPAISRRQTAPLLALADRPAGGGGTPPRSRGGSTFSVWSPTPDNEDGGPGTQQVAVQVRDSPRSRPSRSHGDMPKRRSRPDFEDSGVASEFSDAHRGARSRRSDAHASSGVSHAVVGSEGDEGDERDTAQRTDVGVDIHYHEGGGPGTQQVAVQVRDTPRSRPSRSHADMPKRRSRPDFEDSGVAAEFSDAHRGARSRRSDAHASSGVSHAVEGDEGDTAQRTDVGVDIHYHEGGGPSTQQVAVQVRDSPRGRPSRGHGDVPKHRPRPDFEDSGPAAESFDAQDRRRRNDPPQAWPSEARHSGDETDASSQATDPTPRPRAPAMRTDRRSTPGASIDERFERQHRSGPSPGFPPASSYPAPHASRREGSPRRAFPSNQSEASRGAAASHPQITGRYAEEGRGRGMPEHTRARSDWGDSGPAPRGAGAGFSDARFSDERDRLEDTLPSAHSTPRHSVQYAESATGSRHWQGSSQVAEFDAERRQSARVSTGGQYTVREQQSRDTVPRDSRQWQGSSQSGAELDVERRRSTRSLPEGQYPRSPQAGAGPDAAQRPPAQYAREQLPPARGPQGWQGSQQQQAGSESEWATRSQSRSEPRSDGSLSKALQGDLPRPTRAGDGGGRAPPGHRSSGAHETEQRGPRPSQPSRHAGGEHADGRTEAPANLHVAQKGTSTASTDPRRDGFVPARSPAQAPGAPRDLHRQTRSGAAGSVDGDAGRTRNPSGGTETRGTAGLPGGASLGTRLEAQLRDLIRRADTVQKGIRDERNWQPLHASHGG
ncbi:hypothetical protein DIPPA_33369, partial [Diplonema papillatum]